MSSRKSKARKIIHKVNRRQERAQQAREAYRKPGETDEAMEARMKRDLEGWLGMMTEREVEEGLLAEAERQQAIENLEAMEIGENQVVVSDTEEEK
jgi:hypothetical protein